MSRNHALPQVVFETGNVKQGQSEFARITAYTIDVLHTFPTRNEISEHGMMMDIVAQELEFQEPSGRSVTVC